MFFCEFCEISKNIFFTEHLWATASEIYCLNCISNWVSKERVAEAYICGYLYKLALDI